MKGGREGRQVPTCRHAIRRRSATTKTAASVPSVPEPLTLYSSALALCLVILVALVARTTGESHKSPQRSY
jgi:hypothetical protein